MTNSTGIFPIQFSSINSNMDYLDKENLLQQLEEEKTLKLERSHYTPKIWIDENDPCKEGFLQILPITHPNQLPSDSSDMSIFGSTIPDCGVYEIIWGNSRYTLNIDGGETEWRITDRSLF